MLWKELLIYLHSLFLNILNSFPNLLFSYIQAKIQFYKEIKQNLELICLFNASPPIISFSIQYKRLSASTHQLLGDTYIDTYLSN